MRTHLDRLWQVFDILFLAGLAIAMLLGGKVTPLLVISGVLPIPFLLPALKNRRYPVPLWYLLVPFGLYFTYSLISYFFYTGLEPSDPLPVNPSFESYAIAIAMLAVGLVRGLEVRNLASLIRKLMPWLLVTCFLVMTYMMFAEIRDGCRIRGLAPWPFIPALVFSTLAFLTLVGWERFGIAERWMRVLLLGLSIVVSTTYTGSRGVAVAQVGVFGLLFLMSFLPSLKNRLPRWHHIVCAGVGGLAMAVFLGFATDCGPASRFSSTIATLEAMTSAPSAPEHPADQEAAAETQSQLAPEAPSAALAETEANASPQAEITSDQSISLRLAMWKTSIAAIKERPVFGHGSLYLQILITATYGFEHNHNQYLTWLVTGGILQLVLGLLFISIPWFVSSGLSIADRLLITMAVSVLWGISMMFDSFLNLKFYTHYYCLLCGVLYAWANSMLEGEDR